jgi:hypothetical protein
VALLHVQYERDNARRRVTVTFQGGYEASEIEVFRDTDEAAEWLASQTNAGGDVIP